MTFHIHQERLGISDRLHDGLSRQQMIAGDHRLKEDESTLIVARMMIFPHGSQFARVKSWPTQPATGLTHTRIS